MLRAHLHDALGLALHLDHAHAFVDVVAGGLFAVDVLAGLHGPDGGERVPVVGSGDGDGLDAGVGEHLPHVFEFEGLFLVLSGERCLRLFAGGLVDVAQADDLRLGQAGIDAEVVAAPAAEAHDADVHFIICAPDANRRGSGEGSEEKPASCWIGHYETPAGSLYQAWAPCIS